MRVIAAAVAVIGSAFTVVVALPVEQRAAAVVVDESCPVPAAGSTPAASDGDERLIDAWTNQESDPRGITAGAGGTVVSCGPTGSGGGAGGGPRRPVDCLTIELDPTDAGVHPGLDRDDPTLNRPAELVEGHTYYQECWYVDTGDLYYANVWDQGPPGEPGLNPRVLAQSALSRTEFPVPVPSTAPSADTELTVGIATWLWVDPATWAPIEAHAESVGVSVTVTATPVGIEWDTGDGTVVECDGPGLAWNVGGPNPDESDCSHIYQNTSVDEPEGRYAGSVSIVWSVAWSASTGESGTLPDGRSTAPLSLDVGELQAVVTYGS